MLKWQPKYRLELYVQPSSYFALGSSPARLTVSRCEKIFMHCNLYTLPQKIALLLFPCNFNRQERARSARYLYWQPMTRLYARDLSSIWTRDYVTMPRHGQKPPSLFDKVRLCPASKLTWNANSETPVTHMYSSLSGILGVYTKALLLSIARVAPIQSSGL